MLLSQIEILRLDLKLLFYVPDFKKHDTLPSDRYELPSSDASYIFMKFYCHVYESTNNVSKNAKYFVWHVVLLGFTVYDFLIFQDLARCDVLVSCQVDLEEEKILLSGAR